MPMQVHDVLRSKFGCHLRESCSHHQPDAANSGFAYRNSVQGRQDCFWLELCKLSVPWSEESKLHVDAACRSQMCSLVALQASRGCSRQLNLPLPTGMRFSISVDWAPMAACCKAQLAFRQSSPHFEPCLAAVTNRLARQQSGLTR